MTEKAFHLTSLAAISGLAATLPQADSAASVAVSAEQAEYLKMLGKDPGTTKTGGFPTPLQLGQTAWKHVSNPFYDNGPNDKGLAIQLGYSLARVGLGFLLACVVAIPLGFVIGMSPLLRRAFDPFIQVLKPISPLAGGVGSLAGAASPSAGEASGCLPELIGPIASSAVSAAVVLVGMVALPGFKTSYNDRHYLPESAPSNIGYAAADRHFSEARMNPDLLMIEADHDMRNPADMLVLNAVARNVMHTEGIAMVQNITRPLGIPIQHSSIPFQTSVQGQTSNMNLPFQRDQLENMKKMADATQASIDNGRAQFTRAGCAHSRPT